MPIAVALGHFLKCADRTDGNLLTAFAARSRDIDRVAKYCRVTLGIPGPHFVESQALPFAHVDLAQAHVRHDGFPQSCRDDLRGLVGAYRIAGIDRCDVAVRCREMFGQTRRLPSPFVVERNVRVSLPFALCIPGRFAVPNQRDKCRHSYGVPDLRDQKTLPSETTSSSINWIGWPKSSSRYCPASR